MANTFKLRQSAVSAKVPTTAQLQLGELAINTYDGRLFTKKNVSGTESIVEFVSNSGTWGISINGNAATATTLQNARTINGASFNGSADITTASWGTTRTLTIGNTGKSVDGSAAVSWSLAEIGALPLAGGTLTGDITAPRLISNVAQGTAPLGVTSTTVCTNLNADLLDGYHVGTSGSTIPRLDTSNTWSQVQTMPCLCSDDPAVTKNVIFRDLAQYNSNTVTITGALVFVLGHGVSVGTFYNARIAVTGAYQREIIVEAGGYFRSDNTWANVFATSTHDTILSVQFARTPDGWPCVILANNASQVASSWSNYIRSRIDTLTLAYTGANNANNLNPAYYTTSLVTDLTGYTLGSSVVPLLFALPGSGGTLTGDITAPRLISNIAQGTAPIGVTSTTVCTNLNADLLDGYDVGTSGGTIPLLNTANTWSALQTITVGGNQLLLHPATSAPTVIFRNDGSTFFLLLSDAGASPSGTWNALRPFSVNLTTGAVTIANGLTATLTGNASTATTLQTARAINGTSFNGSANITTTNWGTARTLTIGNTGKSVDGSGNVTWNLAEIGALPAAGGTLTGPLTIDLSATGTGLTLDHCDLVVTGGSVSAPYVSADAVNLNYAPVQPSEATSKSYVDAMAAKDACLVATFNPLPYGVFDSLTGTIAVTYTPFTFTSVSSNTITLTGHQFNTGDCIRLDPSVQDASNYLTVNGTARAPGNTGNWYVVKVDANSIMVSNTLGNAMSGSSVSITITGAVTVTVKIPAVIDGQALSVGSRVLVRSQTSGAANGIYEVADNTINAWSMYRSPDADTWGALSGALVPVPGGTVNNDSLWICTNGSTGTLNTTAVTFRALATASVTYGRSYSTEPSISTTGPVSASRFIRDQGAPATQNTAATLTSTQVGAGILQTTPTAPITLTLPTGTTMEEIVINTGEAYDLSIINTSANAVTIAANTGHTIVGSATIAANTSSLWCFRKTGANTFVAYRIS